MKRRMIFSKIGFHKQIGILSILILFALFMRWYYCYNKPDYIIIESNDGRGGVYPEVHYNDLNKKEQMSQINKIILANLYGPNDFLTNDDVGMDMNFEITYMDRKYLSICYRGTYAIEKSNTNDFCFGVNIDLERGELVSLQQLIKNLGVEKIHEKIRNRNFTTEYGIVTPEDTYVKLEEILDAQNIFVQENNFYNYYLDRDNIMVILSGFPQYGGNYSILKTKYKWH